jgi:hypothetical protein
MLVCILVVLHSRPAGNTYSVGVTDHRSYVLVRTRLRRSAAASLSHVKSASIAFEQFVVASGAASLTRSVGRRG